MIDSLVFEQVLLLRIRKLNLINIVPADSLDRAMQHHAGTVQTAKLEINFLYKGVKYTIAEQTTLF